MNKQNCLLFFFLLLTPAFMQAQNSQAASRQTDPLMVQQGQLAEFKYQLLRFESAWEDRDLETVNIEKQILLDAIKKDIADAGAQQQAAGKSDVFISEKRKILETLTAHKFSFDEAGMEKSLAKKKLFNSYVSMKEKQLAEMESQKAATDKN